MADHLSRLTVNDHSSYIPISDTFPDEQLLALSTCPWYAGIVNYLDSGLATGQVPSQWTPHERRKFLMEVNMFFFDDPYLFKHSPDQITRRCVSNLEITDLLSFCHSEACGGHCFAKKTTTKIL